MGTSDVLKVLKIARAVGECNLRTFKTSLVPINHEMHEQVHTIFYLLYTPQNYSITLLCAPYVLQKTLQWVPKCSHVLFEPIKNVMLWQVNQAWSSLSCLRGTCFLEFGFLVTVIIVVLGYDTHPLRNFRTFSSFLPYNLRRNLEIFV